MLLKRLLSVLLTFVMLGTMASVDHNETNAHHEVQREPKDISTVITYLSIPAFEQQYGAVSDRQNCLEYSFIECEGDTDPSVILKEYTVPEDFYVCTNGDVWVLDTGNKCVKLFDSESGLEKERIDIEDVKYARMFAVGDDVFYVLDTGMNSVIKLQNEGSSRIALPMAEDSWYEPSIDEYYTIEYEMAPLVANMYSYDGSLYLNASIYGTYVLQGDGFAKCEPVIEITDDGSMFSVKKGRQSWQFSSENVGVEVLGSTESGDLYVYRKSTLMYDGCIIGDNYISAYDSDGNMFFNYQIEYDRGIGLSEKHIRMGADGYIYQMVCRDDAVEIIRYSVFENYDGTQQNSIAVGKEIPSNDLRNTTANVNNPTAFTAAIDYSTYSYFVYSYNQHDWDAAGSNFIVPACVVDVGSYGSVTGIPYSRGDEDTTTSFL